MAAKTVFVSLLLLILPTLSSGYGATGHARQQLRLIAISLIEPQLTSAAMQFNLPSLPTTLVDGEHDRLIAQMNVLVAEGLLDRQPMIATDRQLTVNGLNTRRVGAHRYDRPLMIRQSPVRFGHAHLAQTGEIWVTSSATQATQVEVHFQWVADQLAEWLWAPAFDQEPRLARLKASANQPLVGVATLVWKDQQWQLAELNPYAD
ncbi:hypothetical protein BGP77_06455 [Saccharospirillum sp. MSK14-1]|uniref:hypothetical protein n=1 Tax=Saccharospirillum sp. MSK14-1 TaxID=1897632 RepID=UPI000D3DAE60|nr:hypothetical protein [Saccharospirillum sp. MSK14-1]PTY36922.1 hypothetical protein BGP77_06455 [Saccharospirillum sp. MSK14-1]